MGNLSNRAIVPKHQDRVDSHRGIRCECYPHKLLAFPGCSQPERDPAGSLPSGWDCLGLLPRDHLNLPGSSGLDLA
jgi:hypothetical protein